MVHLLALDLFIINQISLESWPILTLLHLLFNLKSSRADNQATIEDSLTIGKLHESLILVKVFDVALDKNLNLLMLHKS
ncbi:hypothetical protein NADFUDRAFT_80879 [Nadsonia fulvescens var. elongata DSM 6958]|uniref:Uncharacterized protein n=1 Tax=Nadsonia fulvescens var. elongata DSM 6958 TaxID=857566 RepID=A0A1E3PQI8_9ASCO|nr:hypothetical protein NADFUDRAFT_80879 [Nadsonia fulvescens var. elongata DSM 6958]